ncbi:MAG: PorT family protein [Prevotellaceae bacterium]|jgi:hypothetical protein|nr:PorT family protein [Prevotellaceae bacterium]
MKAIIYTAVLAAALCSGCLHAQKAGEWQFGINFAPAFSWAPASGNVSSDGMRFAYELSVHFDKYFKERYAFFAGISYMNIGGGIRNKINEPIALKSDIPPLERMKTAKYYIQYLTIPVGLKLKTVRHGTLTYYFQGALLPGVRIGGSCTPEDGEKESFSKDLNLMTCAVQLSLGCLYPASDHSFIKLGLIFDRFFTDALNSSNMKSLPTSLGLQIGFVF